VDTLGDINIYYTSVDPSTGCFPSPLTSGDVKTSCNSSRPIAPQRPTPDFDANKWVGKYIAITRSNCLSDLTFPSVLSDLRLEASGNLYRSTIFTPRRHYNSVTWREKEELGICGV
jgi:hypothetical protein